MDLFEGYATARKERPPLNILIHYLKNIWLYSVGNRLLEKPLEEPDQRKLPFNYHYIPLHFPSPDEILAKKNC